MSTTASASAINAANKLEVLVESYISKLKRRQVTGSYNVAIATCQFLMRVTSISRWSTANEFIELIRGIGKRVTESQPREFAAGNIVRRVLAIVRDELNMTSTKASTDSAPVSASMFQLLVTSHKEKDVGNIKVNEKSDLRSVIIQGIRDLMDEIQSVHENIELMTVDLIHDNEILLTPTPGSSTVFAVMSRVGKVLIGTRSVFVNGGCVTAAGVATVCECAKEHRTPVFTVAGLYKFSPCYPFDRNSLIEVGNSGKVLPYEDSDLVGKCEVTNPLYDYVIPEHIDIYITNIGGFSPNFIYRIILDNYSTDDVDLS